uniref:Reverse transcriptase domain-containing protein n=1 Tax=Bryopsis sp. HV04063 TaxID=1979421 RepID=A0A2P0QIT6_9CHLO|nr:hypothetical protein [Bryopsis sp. HV04063]ARO74078.1 hypothetical protein [Bryopsis sp. HV04063]
MSKNNIYLAWDKINWKLVQQKVRRVQIRIYKAKKLNKISKMHWLQNLLVRSIDAKLLAIQKVTLIYIKSGEYGRTILTDRQKIKLVKKLHIDGKAHPIKKVWKSKYRKAKKQTLEISIIKDQAKQMLAKFALEPEWEAVFEPNSYGYRFKLSVPDAIQAIFMSLNKQNQKWIFSTDIRKSFNKIYTQTMIDKLSTFPLMKKQIESWLNVGILEAYVNLDKHWIFPIIETSNGIIISPLLVNIALHGLETHLTSFSKNLEKKSINSFCESSFINKKSLKFIRFADQFILIHDDKKFLQFYRVESNKWLSKIGLSLNVENAKLNSGTVGFSFLGFQIIQVVKSNIYKAKITPSKKSQKLLLFKIKNIIQKNKAISSYNLIKKLRPVILEWGNYFKFCECKTIYRNLSHRIFLKLRAWVFRRDTRSARNIQKNKYFPTNKIWKFENRIYKDNWVFYGKTKNNENQVSENFLPHLSWIRQEKT